MDGLMFDTESAYSVVQGAMSKRRDNIFTNEVKMTLMGKRASEVMKLLNELWGKNEKIEALFNTEAVEVLGADRVEGVRIKNNQTGAEKTLIAGGYFTAIGHRPNTDLFKGQLEIDVKGYLVHEHDSSKTAIPGVFVAGDAADHRYRQAVTAAGMGGMAAMDVERYLASRE